MRTVKPVQPIRAVRAIGRIMLRPAPSMGQLRLWLWFARRKAKERAASTPQTIDASEIPEEPPHEDVTRVPNDVHIDKRV